VQRATLEDSSDRVMTSCIRPIKTRPPKSMTVTLLKQISQKFFHRWKACIFPTAP